MNKYAKLIIGTISTFFLLGIFLNLVVANKL